MINREWQLSRGKRVALALAVWAAAASFAVYKYRDAAHQTAVILAAAEARSEGIDALLADDHFGLITVNSDGEVLDLNPGAQLLMGIREADAINQNVGALVCGELVDKLAESFRERAATPDSAKVRVVNCDMVGSAVPVRCRLYATRAKSGEMLGVVLVDPRANVKVEGQ